MKREHKIGVGISVSVVIILIIIYLLKKSGDEPDVSKPPASKPPASSPPTELPVDAPTEVVEAVGKLEEIKDRIANAENYREYYRSETNNGLTIVGTLMEQMIDVMVTVLKQPLVAEAISKRVVSKQDADEIAEYIEFLGKEVVKEVEQTPLLRCGRPMVQKTREENGAVSYWMEEGDGDVPEDNCEVYKFNEDKVEEGTKRAAINLYNKVLSVVEKAEERDKMYKIVKNVSIDNYKQYSLSSGREISAAHIERFPEQSRLENIAMAHYKYLGHELKKELGESINIRELTEDEEIYVRYLNRRKPPPPHEEPPRPVKKPSRPVEKFPAYIRFYENCSEKPVTTIEIDRNTLSEDVVNGQIISNPGQKIKRIELGNITILGTSEYTRYKKDVPNIEDVGEEWRTITCFNGGCEKLATVKVLGDSYYDDESVFLRDGNCNSPTDYYKDIKFNYKIKRVKEGTLIEEDAGRMQVSEEIEDVGDAGRMQVSEEIQNVEGYRI